MKLKILPLAEIITCLSYNCPKENNSHVVTWILPIQFFSPLLKEETLIPGSNTDKILKHFLSEGNLNLHLFTAMRWFLSDQISAPCCLTSTKSLVVPSTLTYCSVLTKGANIQWQTCRRETLFFIETYRTIHRT